MNNVVQNTSKIIQIEESGDVIKWPVKVTSNFTIHDLAVVFDIPDGVKLVGPNDGIMPVIILDRGAYDPDKTTWYIGKIAKDEEIVQEFEFEIEDINLISQQPQGMFTVTATATTALSETTKADNISTLVMKVGPACEDLKLRIGTGESKQSANISIT